MQRLCALLNIIEDVADSYFWLCTSWIYEFFSNSHEYFCLAQLGELVKIRNEKFNAITGDSVICDANFVSLLLLHGSLLIKSLAYYVRPRCLSSGTASASGVVFSRMAPDAIDEKQITG